MTQACVLGREGIGAEGLALLFKRPGARALEIGNVFTEAAFFDGDLGDREDDRRAGSGDLEQAVEGLRRRIDLVELVPVASRLLGRIEPIFEFRGHGPASTAGPASEGGAR